MRRTSRLAISALVLACLAGCNGASAPPTQAPVESASTPAQAAPASPPADTLQPAAPASDAAPRTPAPSVDAPPFAGIIWKVTASDAVQPGTTYAFNTDGTLTVQGDKADPPGSGKWTYTNGKLTIEEEGVAYPTDIERIDNAHFDIRSHNPGGSIAIQMVPAK